MKNIFLYIVFIWPIAVFSQNMQLAQNYFDRGDFEKALVLYQEMEQKQPSNIFYIQRITACYQQLQQYYKAEELLNLKIKQLQNPVLYIELGYNFQLQKNQDKAIKNYDIVLSKLKEDPNLVYTIANTFEKKVLLNEALKAYTIANEQNKSMNFDYQMALLQGQLGNIDLMIERLLSYSYNHPEALPMVQNQLSRFMNEESPEVFTTSLRKSLLVNTQKNQDIFWNQFLSWFFVQMKEYDKAFIQEKAIFRRNPEMFYNIINLARYAVQENEMGIARPMLEFILENTRDLELQMEAHHYLLSMDIENAKEKDYPKLQSQIDLLLKQYGITPYSVNLQILKAHFTAFYIKDTQTATEVLNKALTLPLSKYQIAEIKMELSDILLLDEKFNQAIIYYSQIENDLKNDAVGHEASFKVAKSTYYKGDFEWALKQLKVLKSSASQLIANDALEIFLLINDNTVEDSTQVALKKFAKADFKLYQNKKAEALAGFKDILEKETTYSIKDVTLLRIGKIYEDQNDFNPALHYYQQIIENYSDGIYIDEALFFSAEIYRKFLNEPEKAKLLYEKVLFNHQDSIYFIDARKYYRQLRGDNAS